MNVSSIYRKPLYGIVLAISLVLFITALGGGLFGQTTPWMLQWQHKMFAALCHQQPGRSFWIAGQPMAVCSRCFGIYSGFLLIWLIVPFMNYFKKIVAYDKFFLQAVFLLNVIDVIGNMLGFWQNTLISRLLAGLLLGMASAFCIGDVLIKELHLTLKNGDTYGTSRAI